MRADEQQLLLRLFRRPAARVLAGLGLILGLGIVALSVSYYLGVSYDPNVFPWEVMIGGVLSAGFAAGGSGMVSNLRRALETGLVVEQSGPVAPRPGAPPGFAEFQSGPLLFQIANRRVGDLRTGQAQRLCIALGPKPVGARSAKGVLPDRALLISVNDVPRDAPPTVYWQVSSSAPVSTPSPVPAGPGAVSPAPVPGTPPASTVFCDRCGQANESGFNFCRRCGAPRSTVGGRT